MKKALRVLVIEQQLNVKVKGEGDARQPEIQ
jgi:hypothetical protein